MTRSSKSALVNSPNAGPTWLTANFLPPIEGSGFEFRGVVAAWHKLVVGVSRATKETTIAAALQ